MAEIHNFEDHYLSSQEEPFHSYPIFAQDRSIPLVIDNGSFRCRAGWANDDQPKLDFRNLVTRQRSKKENVIQVGNNISNLEAVRWLLRTQFDRDIVTHYDIQEQIFDYVFHHMGIESEGKVDHPVILTETLCNPNYSRQLMSELLFECYQVPRIAYGIDCLFSLYQNRPATGSSDSLVISLGNHNTCIVPYLNKRLDVSKCRRINIGGSHQATFLNKVLQLKYPGHFASLNISRAEELLCRYGYVAKDFSEELTCWSEDDDYYQKHVCKFQLPYTPVHSWSNDTKQASFQKLLREMDDVMKMWKREEKSLISDFEGQWQLFQSEVSLAFQSLFKTLNKCNSLAEDCVKQLQKGVTLLKGTADTKILHNWLEGLRASHHNLCENRSDWLNQKEVLRQKFLAREAADGDEKEEINAEDLSEQETKRKLLVAMEAMEEKLRPEDEESRKLSSLEQLLRDVEAFMNSHSSQKKLTFDLAEYYQLHVGVERIRVPEIMFQPSIVGVDQGGLAETVEFILSQYDTDSQSRLVQNVFLTGGVSRYPNMVERVEAELRMMRPFQSIFSIKRAADPALDAWKGAARWGLNQELFTDGSITKSDYLEKGGEYLKEHSNSNVYFPTPKR